MYSETPRLRHQIADLLTSNGHTVLFYQKPLFFFESDNSLKRNTVNNHLEIRQTKQLLHHQLRIVEPLSLLNSAYEYKRIKMDIGPIMDTDVVINFNYDYSFLRKIYKRNKIITIINDDFKAQAKFNNGKHVLKQLEKTLKISDMTLTVSYPLYDQAKMFTDNVKLFLPWSKESYARPSRQSQRDAVLLWAHIDSRVDLDLIEYILIHASNFKVHLVGPISDKNKKAIQKLKGKYSNLEVKKPCKLIELDLNIYFSAIIPYKAGVEDIIAVTASNKTFNLLSKGLPIVTYGMPHFLENDAIYKANDYDGFIESLNYAYKNFESLQLQIEKLVNHNLANQRYKQIMSIIKV